jgi:ribosomal protein S18 acetylase RimI-like enzyme
MGLDIRKAQLEDAEALAEILTLAVQYKLDHGDKAWGTTPYTPKELRERIAKGNTYAAWLDGALVATFMLLWEDEMMWGEQPPVAAYVHQLAVNDGYHGQGIGEQLMSWAGQQTAKRGRRLLRIDFPPHNAGLKDYYEKLGFKFVKNREIHAPHATYTAALYERPTKL